MSALACVLLLASATSVELADEVYRIPASEWRYVELGLKQRPAFVSASYEVQGGSAPVRLALMRGQDLERLRNDVPHGVIAMTPWAASGTLEYPVRASGDYALVVDNRAPPGGRPRPVSVRLRIWLDFDRGSTPEAAQLSRQRQLVVILISFAVFFGIVSWSARRLLRAFRR